MEAVPVARPSGNKPSQPALIPETPAEETQHAPITVLQVSLS